MSASDAPAAPPEGAAASAGVDGAAIGWGRAIVSGLVLVAVGFFVCAYVPNVLLRHFTGMGRSARADLAGIVSISGVVVMAWLLRRLQARGRI